VGIFFSRIPFPGRLDAMLTVFSENISRPLVLWKNCA
jgi:hypothetical protein